MFKRFKQLLRLRSEQEGSVMLTIVIALLAVGMVTTLSLLMIYYKQNLQNTALYNANNAVNTCWQAAFRSYDALNQVKGSCDIGQCLNWQGGIACANCGDNASKIQSSTNCACEAVFQGNVSGQNATFDFMGYCLKDNISLGKNNQIVCLPDSAVCNGMACGIGALGAQDGCGHPCLCQPPQTCQEVPLGGGNYICS